MNDLTKKVLTSLVRACKLMVERRLVAGMEGNLSARLPDGKIAVTPSGRNKGEITEEDLVILSLEGEVLSGSQQPTSERWMHLEFYRQRQGVGGIAHGHPVFSTAFAAAQRELPDGILPELTAVIGKIPLVPYGNPSSPSLAKSVSPYCRNHNGLLLENHGAIAVGSDPIDAFYKLEVIEAYAKTLYIAIALGGAKSLSEKALSALPRPVFD